MIDSGSASQHALVGVGPFETWIRPFEQLGRVSFVNAFSHDALQSAIEAGEHQRWRSVTWPPFGGIRGSHSMHTPQRAFSTGLHGALVTSAAE